MAFNMVVMLPKGQSFTGYTRVIKKKKKKKKKKQEIK